MTLHKWFLDMVQSNSVSGYYYIMILQIGPFMIGASGIYHFNDQETIRSFKFGFVKRKGLRRIVLSNACLEVGGKQIKISIKHKKNEIRGVWDFPEKLMPRKSKKLYENHKGWVDWRVVAPKTKVKLNVYSGKKNRELEGDGYCDLVRINFLPWQIPFQKLYWGRLHANNAWFIVLNLVTNTGAVSQFITSEKLHSQGPLQVITEEEGGDIKAFKVNLLNGKKDEAVSIATEKTYESMEIMNRGILGTLLPGGVLKKISSHGKDRKYFVSCDFNLQTYTGIMEEVTWNE